ncbi:hypothetical protein ACFQBN_26625 [Cohnella cellulosilytica]
MNNLASEEIWEGTIKAGEFDDVIFRTYKTLDEVYEKESSSE